MQLLHCRSGGRGVICCISDIHGELDKFERMLELIRFSDPNQIYIIGNVIDRGAMGVDVLCKIMEAPNIDDASWQPRAEAPGYPRSPQ